MRVVITNDDGIDAQGIQVLTVVAQSLDCTVRIVAPEKDFSGYSQAITVGRPIRIKRRTNWDGVERYAVSGTPADCVRLAAAGLVGPKPDLILSGVNHGANLGEDIWASGTVGAARMAACRGIPAIAISSLSQDWSWVCHRLLHFLPLVAQWATAFPGILFNLNLPLFGAHLLRWTTPSPSWFSEHPIVSFEAAQETSVQWTRQPFDRVAPVASDAATILGGMASLTALPVTTFSQSDARWPHPACTPGCQVQLPAATAPPKPSSLAAAYSQ